MPRYYGKKKTYRRGHRGHHREYKGEARGGFTLGSFNNYVDTCPIPPIRFAELTYAEGFTISAPNTGLFGTSYNFSLNGLYDPYLPAGGHQPYGFDQLCPTLYERYKVYNARVKITWDNPSAPGIACGAIVIPPGTTYTITGKHTNSVIEAPFSSVKFISDSGSQKVTQYMKLPMNVLFGITPRQFKEDIDTTTGSSSGNPGSQPQLIVSCASTSLTSSSVFVNVEITYWAMFYQRVNLASS